MPRHLALLLLVLPCPAFAQIASNSDALASETAADRWSLGVGVSLRDSPYAGEDTRVRPLPIVTYEGQRLFWRGLSGGVHLMRGETFTLDAILSGRLDGFDIDDLGRTELARNGLDASLLEDRDDGVDAGLAATWRSAAGEFNLRALADVSDASSGYEFAVDYGYPLQFGRTTVVPGVGVRWMSSDLADYYYGTLDKEVARGVPRYRPGSAVVPQVSVTAVRPLGQKWRLFGSVEYKFLPDGISDSPLVEPDTDGTARLVIGISRGF